MAAFPNYVVLLNKGYEVSRASALKRTQFDDGFSKQYKRFSRVLVERPVVYGAKSKADYTSFITWFNTTINRGADWFDWTDPKSGTVVTARIKDGKIQEIPIDPMLEKWDLKFTIETWDV